MHAAQITFERLGLLANDRVRPDDFEKPKLLAMRNDRGQQPIFAGRASRFGGRLAEVGLRDEFRLHGPVMFDFGGFFAARSGDGGKSQTATKNKTVRHDGTRESRQPESSGEQAARPTRRGWDFFVWDQLNTDYRPAPRRLLRRGCSATASAPTRFGIPKGPFWTFGAILWGGNACCSRNFVPKSLALD